MLLLLLLDSTAFPLSENVNGCSSVPVVITPDDRTICAFAGKRSTALPLLMRATKRTRLVVLHGGVESPGGNDYYQLLCCSMERQHVVEIASLYRVSDDASSS